MTASITAITVQTAPRNEEQLSTIGRFQLRRLAETLAMFPSEEAKQAFMSASNGDMAKALVVALKDYDTKNGGAPAAAAGVPASNGIQAPSLSLAPPATTPATGGAAVSKRTPKTNDAATASDVGVDAATALVSTLQNLTNTIVTMDRRLEALGKTGDLSYEIAGKNSGTITSLLGEIEKIAPFLGQLVGELREMRQLQNVGIALNLILAEQVLGAGRNEVLATACEDAASVGTAIQAQLAGKGA